MREEEPRPNNQRTPEGTRKPAKTPEPVVAEAVRPPPAGELAAEGTAAGAAIEIVDVAGLEAAKRERRRAQKRASNRRFQDKLKENPDAIKQRVPSPEGIVERYKGYQRKADRAYSSKPEVRERIAVRKQAYRQRPEVRERERAREKERSQRPDERERRQARQRQRRQNDPEARQRKNAAQRERYQNDPEFRAKEAARKREWYRRQKGERAASERPASRPTDTKSGQ